MSALAPNDSRSLHATADQLSSLTPSPVATPSSSSSSTLAASGSSPFLKKAGVDAATDTEEDLTEERVARLTPSPALSSSDVFSSPSSPSSSTSSADSSAVAAAAASMLQDDYGQIDLSGTKIWIGPDLTLECGGLLKSPSVNYKTFGTLNEAADNVMVVCHALTGHAALDAWWGELLGPGRPFDTSKYFIVCANLLGSCYGTCGPTSINPATNTPYLGSFPIVTVRDCVRLHLGLVKSFGVRHVAAVIGGSLGGMQALEWGFLAPEYVQCIAAIACNAKQNAWQIGINHIQRESIYADPLYCNGFYDSKKPPHRGLSIARQLAMMTYRTAPVYGMKYGRKLQEQEKKSSPTPKPQHTHSTSSSSASSLSSSSPAPAATASVSSSASPCASEYAVEGYLEYQGVKLCGRFDANCYVRLTQMLDSHDVGRGRGGVERALSTLTHPTLVLGVSSDVLYPIEECRELAHLLPNSWYYTVESIEGHDGFLLEQEQIGNALKKFLANHAQPQSTANNANNSGALLTDNSKDAADEEKESSNSTESSASKSFIQHKKGLYRPVFVV